MYPLERDARLSKRSHAWIDNGGASAQIAREVGSGARRKQPSQAVGSRGELSQAKPREAALEPPKLLAQKGRHPDEIEEY